MPKQTQPISEAAYRDLLEWHRQALKFENTGLAADCPDHRLLVSGWPEWPRGLAAPPELKVSPDGSTFVDVTLNKPKEEGTTTRYIDPETLCVVRVHLIPGGSIAIDRSGERLDYYYTRLTLRKGPDGKTRSPYVSRLIVGTEAGYHTKENANFHDLRRAALGPVRLQAEEGPGAGKHGRERATQWTRKAVNEAIERGDDLPTGVDETLVGRWLEDGYRLLDKVPLGEVA